MQKRDTCQTYFLQNLYTNANDVATPASAMRTYIKPYMHEHRTVDVIHRYIIPYYTVIPLFPINVNASAAEVIHVI